MLKALAMLPLLAAPASAYTFVYQCEMGVEGERGPDETPANLSLEITYEFEQPLGWMVGTLGEIEITLREIDDFVIIESVEAHINVGPLHMLTIDSSGSATYQMWKAVNTRPNPLVWAGECKNMRPE